MSVIVKTSLDPIGQMLGTGYARFEGINGVSGLFKAHRPHRLDLLAIVSEDPGKGNFRDFISQTKMEFNTICVWFIENESLYEALLRYGFTPEIEVGAMGDALDGLRWG